MEVLLSSSIPSNTNPIFPSSPNNAQPTASAKTIPSPPNSSSSPPPPFAPPPVQTYAQKAKRVADRSLRRLAPPSFSESGTPQVTVPDDVFERGSSLHKDFIVGAFFAKMPSFKAIENVLNFLWGKVNDPTSSSLLEWSTRPSDKSTSPEMDTPDKNRISAVSFSNFEDSPVFQYINGLSPIEAVKADHVFHSLALPSPSSLFSSPQIENSRFAIKRHHSLDLSSPVISFGESETVKSRQDVLVELKCSGPEEMANVSETKPFKEQVKLAIELASSLRNGEDGCDNQVISSDKVVPMDAENKTARVKEQPDGSYVVFQSEEMEAETGSCEEEIPRTSSFTSAPQQFSIFCNNSSGNVVESCSVKGAAGALDTTLSSTSNVVAIDSTAKAEDKEETGLQLSRKQRSVRRRCLTFDVGGSSKRVPLRDSTNDLPLGFTSINKAPSPQKCPHSIKQETDEVLPIPRTIGLHLNGLVNPSVSSDRDKLTSNDGSVLSHGEDEFTTPVSTTRDLVSCDDKIMEDAIERSMEGEWVEELGSCKRCRCKKSKCLKLYCDCFAAGIFCIEPCSCQNCFNKPIHEDVVMKTRRDVEARNPLAFAPKVVLTSGSATYFGEDIKTPASARHMRGCNCKKSGCSKKYCECYLMGVGCSASCRCIGCKNVLCHTNEQFHFP